MEELIKVYDFVYDLERIKDGITTTKMQSIYEFYKLLPNKKSLSSNTLTPDIRRKYLIYSGLSERYYIRSLKDEDEIEELKYDVEMGAVHLTWDAEQQKQIKEDIRVVSAHYKPRRETLSYYKQYIPLIKNTILYGRYRQNNKDSIGYYTQCEQYEQEQKRLLNL